MLSLVSRSSAQGGAPIEYHLMEEEPAGFQLGDFPKDSGIDNIDPSMTFTLSSPTASPHLDYFTIQLSEGKPNLVTTQIINREKICAQVVLCQIQFNVVIMPIEFFRIIKVVVVIEDRNDNPPTFPQQSMTIQIPETSSPGTTFAIPSAEDLDSSENGIKTYQINPEDGM